MNKLKIKREFRNLIPPLSPEEYQQLEQNILADGKCCDTIKVWRGYIVDGHNRYSICKKHGIFYSVEKLRFSCAEEVKVWIAENQLGRRNLNKAQRIELALLKADKKPTREFIAKVADVCEQTVYKYMQIKGKGSAELVRRVREGDLSVGAAYGKLKSKSRTVEVLYDDNDSRFRNSVACCDNVMFRIGEIGRIYGEMEKVAEFLGEIGGMEEVLGKLDRQLGNVVNIIRGM